MLYDVQDLPTIEQAQEFLVLANKAREVLGLEQIEKINWDDAVPGLSTGCLSAVNFLGLDANVDPEESVGTRWFCLANHERATALGAALGQPVDSFAVHIPDGVRAVTDPFDSQTVGLKERLIEAGVVESA